MASQWVVMAWNRRENYSPVPNPIRKWTRPNRHPKGRRHPPGTAKNTANPTGQSGCAVELDESGLHQQARLFANRPQETLLNIHTKPAEIIDISWGSES
jgi:hypothetical protein